MINENKEIKHKVEYLPIEKLKLNPRNPRIIRDNQYKKLVESIKNNPELFEARPIIVSDRTGDLIIISGNMRYRVAKDLKLKQVPVVILNNLTEDKEKEIMIRDNVNNGDWDWDILASEWNITNLEKWGVDLSNSHLFVEVEIHPKYTDKIGTPIYKMKGVKPEIQDVINIEKYTNLKNIIEKSNCDKSEKEFLKFAATRFIVFDYSKIAELYAHSSKEMQKLMEELALVIIDYNKAIELGFVKLVNRIMEDYDD